MPSSRVITIRSYSGLSGDMFLAGLAVLELECKGIAPDGNSAREWLEDLYRTVLPVSGGKVALQPKDVNGIAGWHANVELPDAYAHRNFMDIKQMIDCSGMSDNAKKHAGLCFELLAACEAFAHGIDPEDVHFHEVGALDSILDICGTCEIYSMLGEPDLICSPLPVADGQVHCAHGVLPCPAPAVLKMLENIPVKPFAGAIDAGELITPTALCLLKGLDAAFGPWPEFTVEKTALIYGTRTFAEVPNGAAFALGSIKS